MDDDKFRQYIKDNEITGIRVHDFDKSGSIKEIIIQFKNGDQIFIGKEIDWGVPDFTFELIRP